MIPSAAPPRPHDRRAATICLVLIAFVTGCGLIGTLGVQNDRIAADQNLFHLPVIRQFAAQWPRPDLSDYASATSPGYHLALSLVDRFVTDRLVVLRAVGGLFGVAFVGTLAWAARGRSAWLALPAAASVYVLTSAVWLLPEDAAWLGVTAVLLLAMHASGRRLFVASAAAFAGLVFVRQSHVWTLLPFATGAYWAWRNEKASPGAALPFPPAKWFGGVALSAVPGLVVLGVLVALWHGLTPPAFRPGSGVELPLATKVGGVASAAPAMVLSLLGLFGVPLLAWLTPAGDGRRTVRWAGMGGVIGFIAGVLPVTTVDWTRKSGIWNGVRALPVVADRSLLIVGLATVGGAVVAITLRRLPPRERCVLAAALIGFTLVQTTNQLVWQRYYEPFCLLWLILAAGVPVEPDRPRRLWKYTGLAGLTLFQIGVTAYTLRRSG